jgi:hypothetical protein
MLEEYIAAQTVIKTDSLINAHPLKKESVMKETTFVICSCRKRFKDHMAMSQHHRDSPKHSPKYTPPPREPPQNLDEIVQRLSLQDQQVDFAVSMLYEGSYRC